MTPEQQVREAVQKLLRFMTSELGASRAMVMLPGSTFGKSHPVAQFGFTEPSIWKDKTIHQSILEDLVNRETSVHLLDSKTHPQYHSREAYRCALGVPLGHGGFLYCDHPKSATLSGNNLRELEDEAQTFLARIHQIKRVSGSHSLAAISQIKESKPLLGIVAIMVVSVLIMGYGAFAAKNKGEQRMEVEKELYTVQVKGLIKNFRPRGNRAKKTTLTFSFPGGDTKRLKASELEFTADGSFQTELKTRMAKVPNLVSVKIEVPNHKKEALSVKVVEEVAQLPDVTLISLRRRRASGDPATGQANNLNAGQKEQLARKKLRMKLKSKRAER